MLCISLESRKSLVFLNYQISGRLHSFLPHCSCCIRVVFAISSENDYTLTCKVSVCAFGGAGGRDEGKGVNSDVMKL